MIGVVRYKAGVRITGCPSPAQSRIIGALDTVARAVGFDLTVTCGEEAHPPVDPHTLRKAFDVRAFDLEPEQVVDIVARLRSDLGQRWTVLYETPVISIDFPADFATVNPGATAPHIHIQPLRGTDYPPIATQP